MKAYNSKDAYKENGNQQGSEVRVSCIKLDGKKKQSES
jgi:hypothetical protein